jgi:ABC-type transport system involved in multi-copper enzyme maturation permease subunit
MRNLLRANLFRLRRDKMFWLCTAAMLGFSMFVVLYNAHIDARDSVGHTLDYFYFKTPPYYSLVLAVAIARFIGTDYDDGTIRNKFIIGHTRSEVYLANLLTCFFSSAMLFAAWAVGGLAGIPYFGLWSMGLSGYFQLLGIELLTFLAMTAILVPIAQLIKNRSANVITIFAAMAVLLLGSCFYNALCEPETYMNGYTINWDGTVEFGEEVANPAYVSGTMRVVYQAILNVLPTGQQIWIADETVTQPVLMGMCSLIVIVVCSGIGLLLFRKKDLK